jgi:hypothetical protein
MSSPIVKMSLVSRSKYFRTFRDTVYLYPEFSIQEALAVTQQPYTYDGTHIVCPTLANISALCYDIWYRTFLSNPLPVPPFNAGGYSLGVGTMLEDLQKEIQFCLSSGEVVLKWRLVRQLTPQTNPPLSSPGSSPVGTIGYVTVFRAMGPYPVQAPYSDIDPVLVLRVG